LQTALTFPNLGFKINDAKLLWFRNSMIFKLVAVYQTVIPANNVIKLVIILLEITFSEPFGVPSFAEPAPDYSGNDILV
jgi:hypothetical protein